jgi:hypothetical protein
MINNFGADLDRTISNLDSDMNTYNNRYFEYSTNSHIHTTNLEYIACITYLEMMLQYPLMINSSKWSFD